MWGKLENQVNRLFNVAADKIGNSRHEDKNKLRADGVKTHNQMAKSTGIYSFGTSNTYVSIWKELAQGSKNLKDIENISSRMVKSYLQRKVNDKNLNKYSSFTKICSAVTKLETALNQYAKTEGKDNKYDFQNTIDKVRRFASHKLDKTDGNGRGFSDSKAVVEGIKNDDHKMVAQFQNETGCRISESAVIRESQFRGLGKDPYTGENIGVVNVLGKGGKEREVYLNVDTYNKLAQKVDENGGLFKVGKTSYTNSVKASAYSVGQIYTGTHDFRHAWVQDRFREVQELGYSDEQTLASVSEEIGHVRPDITEVYLK